MWPWARSRDPSTGGRAGTDPTRAGGADLRTTLALASLVAAATFFDRLKGTLVFLRTVKVRTPFTAWLENVLVLVWAAGLVAALWWGLGLIGSRILRTPGRADDEAPSDGSGGMPGLLLAASLGPIAMSALLAHTFNTLLVQVQNVLVLASDPFARGQDLFGTVNWRIHAPLSVRGRRLGPAGDHHLRPRRRDLDRPWHVPGRRGARHRSGPTVRPPALVAGRPPGLRGDHRQRHCLDPAASGSLIP